jgi:hypothetical protein
MPLEMPMMKQIISVAVIGAHKASVVRVSPKRSSCSGAEESASAAGFAAHVSCGKPEMSYLL